MPSSVLPSLSVGRICSPSVGAGRGGWRVRARRKADDGKRTVFDGLLFGAAELLGMALSPRDETAHEAETEVGRATPARVVADDSVTQSIVNLFESSYFFCGSGDDADWDVFAPDCVFADEFSSFVGTQRFRRNVENFGKALRHSPERVCRLTKLERGVDERGRQTITASWIFRSRVILLRGLLAASGRTTYVVEGARIVEHLERWDTSKADVFKRLLGL
ncbi:MAG: hypothetical protein ABGY24_14275 [bacterium]